MLREQDNKKEIVVAIVLLAFLAMILALTAQADGNEILEHDVEGRSEETASARGEVRRSDSFVLRWTEV